MITAGQGQADSPKWKKRLKLSARRPFLHFAEMNLHKLPDGRYALAEDLYLKRMIVDLVVDVKRAGTLVVVKAETGTAAGVAAALDAAHLDGVVGSVAGDDTILVIGEDDAKAQVIMKQLGGV